MPIATRVIVLIINHMVISLSEPTMDSYCTYNYLNSLIGLQDLALFPMSPALPKPLFPSIAISWLQHPSWNSLNSQSSVTTEGL